ncbi:hypothetical protein ABK040_008857 [Willaertia magna]
MQSNSEAEHLPPQQMKDNQKKDDNNNNKNDKNEKKEREKSGYWKLLSKFSKNKENKDLTPSSNNAPTATNTFNVATTTTTTTTTTTSTSTFNNNTNNNNGITSPSQEEMPNDEELERLFMEAIEEMNIPNEQSKILVISKYHSKELKWQLVQSLKKAMQDNDKKSNVDFYMEQFHKINLNSSNLEKYLNLLRTLSVQLRSEILSWVEEFLQKDGLTILLQILSLDLNEKEKKKNIRDENSLLEQVRTLLLLCLKSLLNTKMGMEIFLNQKPEGIYLLVLILESCCLKNKASILLLLASLCHHSILAFQLTFESFLIRQQLKRLNFKFEDLIESLNEDHHSFKFKLYLIMFFNSLLNTANDFPTIKSQLQKDLQNLNVSEFENDVELKVQVKVFKEEMEMNPNIDDSSIYSLILSQLPEKAKICFLEILNDLLTLTGNNIPENIQEENWRIIRKLIEILLESLGDDGKLKNIAEELEKIKVQNRSNQLALTSVEDKIRREKELIKSQQLNDLSTFEYLKDVAEFLLSGKLIISTSENVATQTFNNQLVDNSTNTNNNIPLPPGTSGFVPPSPTSIPIPPPTMGIPTPPGMTGGSIPTPPGTGIPMPPGMTTGGIPMPPGTGVPMPPGMTGVPMVPPMNKGPQLPNLPNYNPSSNLRNVHLHAITKNKIQNTVFIKKGIIEQLKNIEIDEDKITDLFGTDRNNDNNNEKEQSQQSQQQIQKISLIDSKRSYSIAIQLATLRLSYETIRKAILTLDNEALSKSQVNILRQICPTDEEIQIVSAFDGNVQQLAEPEKFFLDVKDISKLKERLDAWSFYLKYTDEISTVLPDIENLKIAIYELKNSSKFIELLTIVLAITNFMNAKSKQKNSYGFHLSSLQKLKDTKTSNSKYGSSYTLMHYVIEYLEKYKGGKVLTFYDELSTISSAKRVAMSSLKENVNGLKSGMKQVQNILQYFENSGTSTNDNKFIEIIKPFYESSTKEIVNVEEKLKGIQENLEELAALFDEDKGTMTNKPEDFFTMIDEFIEGFKQTKIQLDTQRELEKKKNDKAVSILKKGVKFDAEVAPPSNTNTSNEKKGLLEGIENSLLDGSAFKKRRSVKANLSSLLANEAAFKQLKKTNYDE